MLLFHKANGPFHTQFFLNDPNGLEQNYRSRQVKVSGFSQSRPVVSHTSHSCFYVYNLCQKCTQAFQYLSTFQNKCMNLNDLETISQVWFKLILKIKSQFFYGCKQQPFPLLKMSAHPFTQIISVQPLVLTGTEKYLHRENDNAIVALSQPRIAEAW